MKDILYDKEIDDNFIKLILGNVGVFNMTIDKMKIISVHRS